jgi:hypothetical protein
MLGIKAQMRKNIIAPLLGRLGYQLVSEVPEWERKILTECLQRQRSSLLKRKLAEWFFSIGSDQIDSSRIDASVTVFLNTIEKCPIKQDIGGSGFMNSIALFAYMYCRNPSTVVESGTFRGLTAYLIAEAAPNARVITFDINHNQLTFRHPRVQYIKSDLTDSGIISSLPGDTVFFFDDHINHLSRMNFLHEHGFFEALFDDNYGALSVQYDGLPPIPTVDMVLDTSLEYGVEYRWRTSGGDFSYFPDQLTIEKTRAIIRTVSKIPPTAQLFGHKESFLTSVILQKEEI